MSGGVKMQFRRILAELVYFGVRFIKRLFFMQDGTCRFEPTCSQYTREAIQLLPLHKALPKIIRRVSRCHPRGGFGYDPVIPKNVNQKEKM